MGISHLPSKKLLLAIGAFLPICAVADISYYAGAGAGGVRVEGDLVVTTTGLDTSTDPSTLAYTFSSDGYEATDVGYRVFAGMRIGQYFGVEGGYISFGSIDDSFSYSDEGDPPGCNPATPPSGNCNRIPVQSSIEQDIDLNGFEFYAMGRYPFAENWEAFAKLGVVLWDLEYSASDIFADNLVTTPGQQNIPDIHTSITRDCKPQNLSDPSCPDLGKEYDDDGTDLAWGLGVNYKASERVTLRGEGTWFDIEDTDKAWMLGFDVIYNF